jgi:sugar phosphate isomerase/epimerase
MERRNFLSKTLTATGGMLALGCCPMINLNCRRSVPVPVGAHVWVYAKGQPGFDVSPILDRIFADMQYAGIDVLELMEHPFRSIEKVNLINELKDQYEVPVIGISYGADMWDSTKHIEIFEDVENIMENLARVKARTFGTSVGRPSGRIKTEKELDSQADLLKRLISTGKKNGIVLNLHNHTYEVENNLFDLRGTLKRIPDIKLGPDLNWLLRADVDPISFLHEFKDNIVFLHLRDQLKNGQWPESLGEGDVDFKEIKDALKSINFRGDIVIELAHENNFTPTRPIRESLKMSRDHVRRNMGY